MVCCIVPATPLFRIKHTHTSHHKVAVSCCRLHHQPHRLIHQANNHQAVVNGTGSHNYTTTTIVLCAITKGNDCRNDKSKSEERQVGQDYSTDWMKWQWSNVTTMLSILPAALLFIHVLIPTRQFERVVLIVYLLCLLSYTGILQSKRGSECGVEEIDDDGGLCRFRI